MTNCFTNKLNILFFVQFLLFLSKLRWSQNYDVTHFLEPGFMEVLIFFFTGAMMEMMYELSIGLFVYVCLSACVCAWWSVVYLSSSLCISLTIYCLNISLNVCGSLSCCLCMCRAAVGWTLVPWRPSVFDAELYETCLFTHVCVFSLFLTPMFVLLQDSVPMASPAFLLSLFVSIQVLPQISPEPGYAPHTLVSTPTYTHTHSHIYTSVCTPHCFSQFSSSLVALNEAKQR